MKDYDYPIFFSNGTCVHCGEEKSVITINKFGIPSKNDSMYPISHMKCTKCGRVYYIRWDSDNKDFDIPVAISKNYIDLFAKLIKLNTEDKEK